MQTFRKEMIRCQNCFFVDRQAVRITSGKPLEVAPPQIVYLCRRNPPRIPDNTSNQPHPVVQPEIDWCGEFSPAERFEPSPQEVPTNGQEEPVRELAQGQEAR